MKVLIISSVLFGLGAYGVLSRRNLINVLMCIEIMLAAGNLNLVYFSRFGPAPSAGAGVLAVMTIAVAAAETAVGLALALAVYRRFRSVVVDDLDLMSG